uniref:Strictosidine synthase conserved region domain-containing protein n=1 Tax=Parascaris univalens TaxID=6257 RepID=A0A914ZKU2_PARUN
IVAAVLMARHLRRRRKGSVGSTHSEIEGEQTIPQRRRSPMSLWTQLVITVFVALSVFLTIVFIYPSDDVCVKYELPQRTSLEGPLAPNDILKKAERFLENQVLGPESLLVENETIYTGTQDGIILEIYNGEIRREIRFKSGPCGSYEQEPICGRPLGIRRLNSEEIVVMDAYFGIFSVNFGRGTFKQIFDSSVMVDGEPLKFVNDVDVVDEDFIIFTDSSSKWSRRDFLKIVMEGVPNGRVFSLVPSTGEVKVLMKNLYFANGIQLFPDKKSFLVAETMMARIKRHWISGPKRGTTEIFAENLPGLPDNIRLSTDGTFWVGMAGVRLQQQFSLLDFLADKIVTRKLLLKLIPDPYWSVLYSKLNSRHAMFIELDPTGKIVSSAHDVDGMIMTEASEVDDDDIRASYGWACQ